MKLIADLRSLLHKPDFMPTPAIASPTILEFLVCSQARNLSKLEGDVSGSCLISPISFVRVWLYCTINRPPEHCPFHLCAWGNDAVSEEYPRRVNCWLKTISNPPLVLARAPENFCKVRLRLGPHN